MSAVHPSLNRRSEIDRRYGQVRWARGPTCNGFLCEALRHVFKVCSGLSFSPVLRSTERFTPSRLSPGTSSIWISFALPFFIMLAAVCSASARERARPPMILPASFRKIKGRASSYCVPVGPFLRSYVALSITSADGQAAGTRLKSSPKCETKICNRLSCLAVLPSNECPNRLLQSRQTRIDWRPPRNSGKTWSSVSSSNGRIGIRAHFAGFIMASNPERLA